MGQIGVYGIMPSQHTHVPLFFFYSIDEKVCQCHMLCVLTGNKLYGNKKKINRERTKNPIKRTDEINSINRLYLFLRLNGQIMTFVVFKMIMTIFNKCHLNHL